MEIGTTRRTTEITEAIDGRFRFRKAVNQIEGRDPKTSLTLHHLATPSDRAMGDADDVIRIGPDELGQFFKLLHALFPEQAPVQAGE